MAYCAHCGTKSQDAARYCTKCGLALNPASPAEHPVDTAQPADGTGATGNVSRPSRKELAVLGGALLLTYLGAGIGANSWLAPVCWVLALTLQGRLGYRLAQRRGRNPKEWAIGSVLLAIVALPLLWLLADADTGGTGGRRFSTRRLKQGAVGLVVLAGLAIAGVAMSQASSFSGVSAASGVHICTTDHYDKPNLTCTQDDANVSDLSNAKVAFTGPNGGSFTSPRLTITLQKQDSSGAWEQVGTTTDNSVDVSFNRYAYPMDTLVSYLTSGGSLDNGGTYRISVEDPNQSLGSATFTYQSGS